MFARLQALSIHIKLSLPTDHLRKPFDNSLHISLNENLAEVFTRVHACLQRFPIRQSWLPNTKRSQELGHFLLAIFLGGGIGVGDIFGSRIARIDGMGI